MMQVINQSITKVIPMNFQQAVNMIRQIQAQLSRSGFAMGSGGAGPIHSGLTGYEGFHGIYHGSWAYSDGQMSYTHQRFDFFCGMPGMPQIPNPSSGGAGAPQSGVAANEKGRIWGDPHFIGGDGGRFDVQGEAGKTYNLMSDTGLMLNGKFEDWGKGKTVVGETGLTLSGPGGQSQITMTARPKAQTMFNGQVMQPGTSVQTADGGTATLSQDGKKLTIKTAEGYIIEKEVKAEGSRGHMEINVRTPANGVAMDGRLPGGLLGHTFDRDKNARNSGDKQGKGAITGKYTDYEVPGGVFGHPNPKVAPNPTNLDGFYRLLDQFGLKPQSGVRFPGINPVTLQPVNWGMELNQLSLNNLTNQSIQNSKKEIHSQDRETNRLLHLLTLALSSGNTSLAMLIFAHIETKQSNELNKAMVGKLQKMQAKRRQLSQQMAQVGEGQGAAGKMQQIQSEVQSVNDDLNMIQSFIKDISDNKQRTQQMVNGFLSKENETAMSIARSFGR